MPNRGRCFRPGLRLFLLVLLTALFASRGSFADTIVLKNGRRIRAESVSEEGDKAFYEAEGGRISLPKSLIERIEKTEGPQSEQQGIANRGQQTSPLFPVICSLLLRASVTIGLLLSGTLPQLSGRNRVLHSEAQGRLSLRRWCGSV
jgi:hypothetical protein